MIFGGPCPPWDSWIFSSQVLKNLLLGIQTEVNPQLSGQQDHWRAAMEHNKAVLASQENEMKEYLKRQQVSGPLLPRVATNFAI